MRYLRRIVILLFICTTIGFVYYHTQVLAKLDQKPPVITADADTLQVSVDADEEQLLAGVKATDERDGDVSDTLMVESTSKFTSPGKCTITYAAFDAAGNVARYTRKLEYTDYESPKIYLNQPLRYDIAEYNIPIIDRVTAEDCIDGNISGQVKYALAENLNYYTPGEYIVAIQVSNSYGDTYKLELQAELLDSDTYYEPCPLLSDYIVYTKAGESLGISDKHYVTGIQQGKTQTLFNSRNNTGNYDVSQVSMSGDVDYKTPGVYRVIYTFNTENSEGDKVTRGSVSQYIVVTE